MNQSKFIFPLIAFSQSTFHIAREENEILVCSKTALRNGFYKQMKIIDSSGILYNVIDAKKVKGHGLFWGYTFLFNQRIEVELIINKTEKEKDISEFKKMLFKHLKKGFWESGDNYLEVVDAIKKIDRIDETIQYLSKLYYNE